MRLEEFQRGVGVHLRGDYAQQVILHADAVYCADLVALHHKAQAPGEFAHELALPVEVDADYEVVKYESGLGEQRGAGYGLEGEFVVKAAVVVYAAVAPAYALRAGAVRDYLENYLLCRHHPNVYLGLGAGEAPDYARIVFFADGNFVHHLR